MKFKKLNIISPILKAIEEIGYTEPTDIQLHAIPVILDNKDILGSARTGTGKTAAFAIPILQMLHNKNIVNNKPKKIKVLVLTPTRELAIQVRDNFRNYGKYTGLKASVILGGVNQKSQIEVLKKGLEILIATPGRLLDLINQKHVDLSGVEYLVLDEADSMLDMGFIHDVKKIISYIPSKRQTLMFSATMPDEIKKLADTFLVNQVNVFVAPVSSTNNKIEQAVYFVDKKNKTNLLLDILEKINYESVLIFTRTKHGANKLVSTLLKNNINCAAIHGNKSQSARQKALTEFKSGKIKVLVATDIAARGIDINGLSHVINYDFPETPETYVHRIGRTGRAGSTGNSISLCNFDEKSCLFEVERLTKENIPVVQNHGYPMLINVSEKAKKVPKKFVSNKSIMKSSKPIKKGGLNKKKSNYKYRDNKNNFKKKQYWNN